MNRLAINLSFIFDTQHPLLLKIDIDFENEPINLSLSTFLQFLYQNEKKLHPSDMEVAYSLAKSIKKVSHKEKIIYAIVDDLEMAIFLNHAINHDIKLFYKTNDKKIPILHNAPLPIEIEIKSHQQSIQCSCKTNLHDPLSLLMFQMDNTLIIFSNGVLKSNLNESFIQFIEYFIEQKSRTYHQPESYQFIKEIYQKNKDQCQWILKNDLSYLIPEEVTPVAKLYLAYENNILQPTLKFLYKDITIDSQTQEQELTAKNGQKINRMLDLESIFQTDLMTLFTEHDCPFLLQNPEDICLFMDKIIPILKQRDWIIESNVPDFNIIDKPVDISFKIESSQKNWFHFNPNCEINGQNVSLQELARLMVQNQG